MRKIDVFGTYNEVPDKLIKGKTAIITDVMRAATSIITALHNGCKAVIPTSGTDEAVRLAQTIKDTNLLRGGEQETKKITGFDFGNSPSEYTAKAVSGKTIVMTTTNGTRAIRRGTAAGIAFVGAFINASAVARAAVSLKNDIIIICAGTYGRFSTDDVLAAGAIIDRIAGISKAGLDIDDLGYTALELYKQHKANLKRGISNARHYNFLMENGMEDDINFCLQEDISNTVPYLKESLIQVYKPGEV